MWPLVLTSVVYYVVGTDLLGVITVGTFVAFLSAYGFFHSALRHIPRTVEVYFTLSRLWGRCKPLFDAPLERVGPTRDPGRLSGAVDLTGVTVTHGLGPAALDEVDLHVAPGEYVGITGPTGAGKSTVVRLLLGFEVPASGTVAYDSVDFADLDVELVRAQLGVVTQGMRPIGDTVRDVVTGMREVADDDLGGSWRRWGFPTRCAVCRWDWTPASAPAVMVSPGGRCRRCCWPGRCSASQRS